MKNSQQTLPVKMQIYSNGVVTNKDVFMDGIYIYTREYWTGLSPSLRAKVARKHPKILSVFEEI